MAIPQDFINYWRNKKRMRMTLEECWAKWEPYWHRSMSRQKQGLYTGPFNEVCVLGRYGDKGDYTVDNCRVITHLENTLERDHKKCVSKLKGKVHNPRGGASIPKHRNGGCRISTPCGEFEHCGAAAKKLGLHRSSVWHRVNSTSKDWQEWLWIE